MSPIFAPAPRPMMSLAEMMIIVVLAGVIMLMATSGPDFDRTHRYPRVVLSSANDPSDFAGEFFQGGRLSGDNLSILPEGRYSFFRSCCTGIYDREAGYVRLVDGNSVLSPLGPTRSKAERTVLPIRWGNRRYLIPPDRMPEFCYAIIDGDEPRDEGRGHFYLRHPIPGVTGIPELPEEWAAFLRENLVIGSIVEVTERGRVRLDLGSRDGIEEGDVLAIQGRDRWGPRRIQVVSVEERSCVADERRRSESDSPVEAGRCVVMQRELGRDSTPPVEEP